MRSRLFARSAEVAIAFDMDSSSVVQKRIGSSKVDVMVASPAKKRGELLKAMLVVMTSWMDIEATTVSSDGDIIRLGWKGPARSGNRL